MIVDAGGVPLPGFLTVPPGAGGVVAFAHGSGSSRHSPRNAWVAAQLNRAGFATLLFDLLTPAESTDRANVFDIPLLGRRMAGACRWLAAEPRTSRLPQGLFGASTGAAAALVAAAELPGLVRAVVSRGGRPDLAAEVLGRVLAPTLLIVGGRDSAVLELNRRALAMLPGGEHRLVIVPGAGHLFEEPGALAEVARLATEWFATHLPGRDR